MGSFLRALRALASYDKGPPGPNAQVNPPPTASPPTRVPQPMRVNSLRRDRREGGVVDSDAGVWGSGTAVVMLQFYIVHEGEVHEPCTDVCRCSSRSFTEVVTMDGFTGFESAAGEELPKAWAVIDPFHVVSLAFSKLDQCRRRTQRAIPCWRDQAGDRLYQPAAPCALGLVCSPTPKLSRPASTIPVLQRPHRSDQRVPGAPARHRFGLPLFHPLHHSQPRPYRTPQRPPEATTTTPR